MLNQRQLEILLELCEAPGTYRTAAFFAREQGVGIRTIQSDMRAIRKELEGEERVAYRSMAARGSRIEIRDPEGAAAFKQELYQRLGNVGAGERGGRIGQILLLLLDRSRPMTYEDLEEAVFVSRTTLLGDLRRVGEVLGEYHLELLRGSHKIAIDGGETDIRRCIGGEDLLFTNAVPDRVRPLEPIKDALVETFVAFRHNVSEVDLNNLILYVQVALYRLEGGHPIGPGDLGPLGDLSPEREIATAVSRRITEAFGTAIPEAETDHLALYLKGQGDPAASAISPEVDDLVLDGLREIRAAFGIDLTDDVDLRIALALHCSQLLVRLRYDMQMESHIVGHIRQNFPQGFDLATYFASFLQTRTGKKVRDEEIAFIAIHMYKGLSDLQANTGTRKILVISSLRRSENVLIRQTLYKWFPDQIGELFFLPPSLMDESYLDRYDTFLTTEKGRYHDMGLAFYISPFPGPQDYLNIKLVLDGFESIEDILRIFHPDLFEVFHQDVERDGILDLLCGKAGQRYGLEGLREAVGQREALGSTFFGNGIAAPHPISAVSSDTFIAVGISPRPVEWDRDGDRVQIVLLVCVGKNNPKAFQIWNYLSKLFAGRTFAARLLTEPSYERFLRLLKEAIAEET